MLKIKLTQTIVYAVRSNDLRLRGHAQMMNFSLIKRIYNRNLDLHNLRLPLMKLPPTVLKPWLWTSFASPLALELQPLQLRTPFYVALHQAPLSYGFSLHKTAKSLRCHRMCYSQSWNTFRDSLRTHSKNSQINRTFWLCINTLTQ